MSRNNPSELHVRAQRDDIHDGPPASWPRRERDRPGRTSRKRKQRGRSSSPGVIHLHKDINRPRKAGRKNTGVLDAASLGRSKPKRGWYRSKRSRKWHDVRKHDGIAVCGATPLRTAGPRKRRELVESATCKGCLT